MKNLVNFSLKNKLAIWLLTIIVVFFWNLFRNANENGIDSGY